MPSCPSCSREVAGSATFCGYCGAAIGGPAPGVREPFAGAQPAPSYWICPQCSAENTADSQFCRACGAAPADPAAATVVVPPPFTSAPRWRCATCNELNDPGAQFCYYCGVPAGAAPAAAAAAVSATASAPPWPGPGMPSGGQGLPPLPSPQPRSGSSGGRWLVLAAAFIAVAAIAGAVAYVALYNPAPGGDPPPTPPPTTIPPTTIPPTTTPPTTPPPPDAEDVTYYATARASSTLDPAGGNYYYPDYLLDNDIGTCWAEGAAGYGEGQWIRFNFDETMVLTKMKVMPGYGKGWDSEDNVDRWYSNGRLESVQLDFSDGSWDQFTFENRKGWQTIKLDRPHARWLKMTILSAYPYTSGWGDHAADDTSVSEVKFFGWLESDEP